MTEPKKTDKILSPIKKRIFEYLTEVNTSKESFYADTGISASNFKGKGGESELGGDKIVKILTIYSDINAEWLLLGEGEKFKAKSTKNVTLLNGDKKGDAKGDKRKVQKTSPTQELEIAHVFKLRTDRIIDKQMIPIYDMEAVAGLVSLFTDSYSQTVIEVMETTLIPKCDGGIRIVGDSMYPLLKSGDVVFYKQINDIRNAIIWGEMYLVSFENDGEEYVAVKYINKAPDKEHITLVSYNQHHAPLEIHIGRIRALALVKASLRLNSLK